MTNSRPAAAVASKVAKCGISVLDSPAEMMRAVLNYLGRDPNSQKPEDLAALIFTSLDNKPLESAGRILLVAVGSAEKGFLPVLEKIAGEYENKIIIAKVNTDENPEWAMKYGVQGIPTMLFVRDGQIVDAGESRVLEHVERYALARA